MALDLVLFADKLRRVRDLLKAEVADVAQSTGISHQRLVELELGTAAPTGDEILILADHFREDYRFFISNEQKTAFERTEKLFRAYDHELVAADRRAIQEFLFLCDNEAYLREELGKRPSFSFSPTPKGNYAKGHGLDAAQALRKVAGYTDRDVPEVFQTLRSMGFHVFRRRLANENISGLFIDHPSAGPCLLINYSEDVYRQRFTAAHEAAHALFDRGDEFVISFSKWLHSDLREIRADAFAGAFLVPPGLLAAFDSATVGEAKLLDLAAQLRVSVAALLRALVRDRVLSKEDAADFKTVRLPKGAKTDPELPRSLTEKQRVRKAEMLQQGLSSAYVELCVEAFQKGVITRARLGEVLLLGADEVNELQTLFPGRAS